MEYPSRPVEVRAAATDLTAATVYNTGVAINSTDQHSLLIEYDPDTDSTNALEVIVEVSFDDLNTADASSKWVQLGLVTWSSGTGTFTASTLSMASGAAATYAHWDFETQGKKIRVGVKETLTPGDYGNATIWLFSRSA